MIHIKYFGSECCVQCKAALPRFKAECEALGLEYTIIDAEAEDSADILATYGIRGIPHIVVEKDGDIILRGHAAEITPKLKDLK